MGRVHLWRLIRWIFLGGTEKQVQAIPPIRRLDTTLLSVWIILWVSGAGAVLADAPLIPLLTAIPLLIAVFTRRAVPVTTRYLVYSFTLAVLIAAVLNEVYPLDPDRFFLPISTEIAFPFLLSLSVTCLFLPQRPLILGSLVVLSLLALMLLGGMLNDPVTNVRLLLPPGFWTNRFQVFGAALALVFIGVIPLLHIAAGPLVRKKENAPPYQPATQVRIALALFLFVGGTVGSSWLMNRYFDVLERAVSRFVPGPHGQGGKIIFSSEVDLFRTVSAKNSQQQMQPVIRAVAAIPPGYLRLRAYRTYQNGKWQSAGARSTLPGIPLPGLSSRRFSLISSQSQSNSGVRIDIYPTGNMRLNELPVPGNSKAIELIADGLEVSNDGTLQPRRWDRGGGLSVWLPEQKQTAAWNRPERQKVSNAYLQVPQALRLTLAPIERRLFAGAPQDVAGQIRHLAAALREYATYSLTVPPDSRKKQDPISRFLLKTRRGHCELFASSAVLLLRLHGIPARYVTGYVCEEPATNNIWLARLRDCHAWAEAYNPVNQTWTLVEATPASGVPNGKERVSLLRHFMERLGGFWRIGFATIKRGYFARAVYAILARIQQNLSNRAKLLILLALPLLAAGFLLLRRRQHKGTDRLETELKKWLKRLGFDVAELTNPTIGDLIAMIKRRQIPNASARIQLLRDYERLRYRPKTASPETRNRLLQQLRQ